MPAAAALDEFDPAALVMLNKLAERDFHLALTHALCDLRDG